MNFESEFPGYLTGLELEFKWISGVEQLGPVVPGGQVLEVAHKFGLIYAKTELGWYWYRCETDEWVKV